MRLTIALAIGLVAVASAMLVSSSSSEALAPYTVNSTADPGVGTCDVTECTLREAIDASNASPGLDVINFDTTVFPLATPATITVDGDLPNIAEPLTIDGTDAGVVLEGVSGTGLLVRDTYPATDTNFTLVGDSFTIQGFSPHGISVCGDGGAGCGSGPVRGVSITGVTIDAGVTAILVNGSSHSDIIIDNNPSITGGDDGSAISIENAASNSNVSVSGNSLIAGGIQGVTITGGVTSDVSIDRNTLIYGSEQAIALQGGANSDVSISRNAEILGAQAINIGGDANSGFSISHNGSIDGTDFSVAQGGFLTAIQIGGTTNTDMAVRDNGFISGGHGGVEFNGTTNTGISVDKNASIRGAFDSGVAINGVTNRDLSVSRNGSIEGAVSSGDSVLVTADVTDQVRVIGNALVTSGAAGFGIVVEGAVSNSSVLILGNRVNAGFVGIGVVGENPAGALNRVRANVVEAADPDAVFGILLLFAERTRVASNEVSGFAGSVDLGPPTGLVGGGIGVIFGSSGNLIERNVVNSAPDLFWDGTGTENVWTRNVCDTSVPAGLCD